MDRVDIKKFMGQWYVITNIPTFIEKGISDAVETYTLNDKGDIDVLFQYKKSKLLSTLTQKARVHNKISIAIGILLKFLNLTI